MKGGIFFMFENLLIEWGTEILFGILSASAIGLAKWYGNKQRKAKDQAEENAKILAEQ
jgi:hypothetical protein